MFSQLIHVMFKNTFSEFVDFLSPFQSFFKDVVQVLDFVGGVVDPSGKFQWKDNGVGSGGRR